jgi:hypothetical protein
VVNSEVAIQREEAIGDALEDVLGLIASEHFHLVSLGNIYRGARGRRNSTI